MSGRAPSPRSIGISRRFPLDDTIVATVPARTEYLQVLRATATAVGARMDLTIDVIDDTCLALDEAAGWLLSLRGTTLTLRLRPGKDSLEAIVSIDAAIGDWPPPGFETSLPWQILSAVADEVAFEPTADGPGLRIRKLALPINAGA